MKKIYEAPEMIEEVVCVESLLSGSGDEDLTINDNGAMLDDVLGKDRNDNWGGLLW